MGRLWNEKVVEKSSCSLVMPQCVKGLESLLVYGSTDRVQLASGNCSKKLNIRATYQRQ